MTEARHNKISHSLGHIFLQFPRGVIFSAHSFAFPHVVHVSVGSRKVGLRRSPSVRLRAHAKLSRYLGNNRRSDGENAAVFEISGLVKMLRVRERRCEVE